ncbi:hypothetical protein HOY80DRAFT_895590 [Tuber brumale]|nr:hypothetical protein HOY80DRAFT_895590 [Tuber brumale]
MLHCLIDDEGTRLALREYLAGAGKRVTGQSIEYAILAYWQTGILPFKEQPELKDPPQCYTTETEAQLAHLAAERDDLRNTLSCQTAVKWLHEMGYKFRDVRKGVYKDGHKRGDVIQYRQEHFLPARKAFEECMVCWELVNSEEGEALQIIYPTNLPSGVRPIIFIVYDESTFNANDGWSKIWIKENHVPLKKKTHGKGIMVSDFLTPGGRLRVSEDESESPISEYRTSDQGPKRLDP